MLPVPFLARWPLLFYAQTPKEARFHGESEVWGGFADLSYYQYSGIISVPQLWLVVHPGLCQIRDS